MEEVKHKDEKRKAKLKENLGIGNVQSRFLEDPLTKPVAIIEEITSKPAVHKKPKRGSSLAPLKTHSSTSNFNRTTKEEDAPTSSSQLEQIYNVKPSRGGDNKVRTKSENRARTPKVYKKSEIMPIDEKTEEDMEKD